MKESLGNELKTEFEKFNELPFPSVEAMGDFDIAELAALESYVAGNMQQLLAGQKVGSSFSGRIIELRDDLLLMPAIDEKALLEKENLLKYINALIKLDLSCQS